MVVLFETVSKTFVSDTLGFSLVEDLSEIIIKSGSVAPFCWSVEEEVATFDLNLLLTNSPPVIPGVGNGLSSISVGHIQIQRCWIFGCRFLL